MRALREHGTHDTLIELDHPDRVHLHDFLMTSRGEVLRVTGTQPLTAVRNVGHRAIPPQLRTGDHVYIVAGQVRGWLTKR